MQLPLRKVIPSESELQSIYGMSKQEATVCRLKLEGMYLYEIADYLNISLQTVKNTMRSVNVKVKERERNKLNIITINQQSEGIRRKAVAKLALSLIAIDQEIHEYYEGTHTICLFNVDANTVGDTQFVREACRSIDLLANNDAEAKDKAERIYKAYLDAGGKHGELGYGFSKWLMDTFYVKYDFY